LSLYKKYRPKNFEEVIGNEGMVATIKSKFDSSTPFPQAVLFQGPTGCGKTTFGRILRDMLGCLGQDYLEINSANNRGIETARLIMDGMKYLPMSPGGKCRIYLLDEVHQTSPDFQNALLKPLEDTPEHVYFILCTTDPTKLLATVRNRCTMFEVLPLTENQLVSLMTWVLTEEGVFVDDYPAGALKQIAEVSSGCPRQALVILDEIIDLPQDKVLAAIQDLRVADASIVDLCKALLTKQSWKRVNGILDKMDTSKPEGIRRAVTAWMSAEVKRSGNLQAALIYDDFKKPFYDNGVNDLIMACFKTCTM
jgi:DNA polymerase-3 subunit gamma/tau